MNLTNIPNQGRVCSQILATWYPTCHTSEPGQLMQLKPEGIQRPSPSTSWWFFTSSSILLHLPNLIYFYTDLYHQSGSHHQYTSIKSILSIPNIDLYFHSIFILYTHLICKVIDIKVDLVLPLHHLLGFARTSPSRTSRLTVDTIWL